MDTQRSTPSNRIIALAVIVVAVVVAAWLIRTGEARNAAEKPEVITTGQRIYTEEQDADGDGLRDWEEVLWGFDKNNPDTDGDGTGDAQERDELRQKTQTLQQQFTEALDPTKDPNWDSMSYTEQVSGLLLSKYLTAKQDGVPLTEDDALAIVEDIPTYQLPARTKPVQFTLADLNISKKKDAAALRAYGNAVGSVLSVPEGETVPNELMTLVSFLQGGSEDVFLSDIKDILRRYDLVISGMRGAEVPAQIASQHLAALNALSAVRADIQDFSAFAQDPFLALSVFTAYNEDVILRGETFSALRAALTAADIAFSEDEPGYVLMSSGTQSL